MNDGDDDGNFFFSNFFFFLKFFFKNRYWRYSIENNKQAQRQEKVYCWQCRRRRRRKIKETNAFLIFGAISVFYSANKLSESELEIDSNSYCTTVVGCMVYFLIDLRGIPMDVVANRRSWKKKLKILITY